MQRPLLFLFFAFNLLAPAAWAQDLSPYSATFDMQLPPASVASCPGPLSLAHNPAELSWAPSFDLLFVHQQRLDVDQGSADRVFVGGADALMMKLGRLGFSVQWVRPYDDEDRFNYLKYTLATPLISHSRWFSLAAAVEVMDPTDTNEGSSVDFMLGAMIRPLRYVSLGIVGRNLGRAKINDEKSNRALDLGIAVRPLWFAPERVTLTADYRLMQDADDPPVRFTGYFRLIDGLSIFGNADIDGNFGAGLLIDFQRVGTGGYVSLSNDQEIEPDSVLLTARLSSENHPGFIVTHNKTAEFTLDNQIISGRPTSIGIFRRQVSAHDVGQAIRKAAKETLG